MIHHVYSSLGDEVFTTLSSVPPELKEEIHQILNQEEPNEQEFDRYFQEHFNRPNLGLNATFTCMGRKINIDTQSQEHTWKYRVVDKLDQLWQPSLMQLQ